MESKEKINSAASEDAAPSLGRLHIHPAVTWISFLFGAFSTIFGVYAYLDEKVQPNLSYFVRPIRTVLVQAGEASNLSVNWGGIKISSDVTIAQIAVWNAGKKPITPGDILSPFQITTENHIPILAVKVQTVSRPLIGLTLDEGKLSEGVIGAQWKVLERGDGAVIQIIYNGNQSISLNANAVLIGQPSIENVTYHFESISPEQKYNSLRSTLKKRIAVCISGLAGFAVTLVILLAFKRPIFRMPFIRVVSFLCGAIVGIFASAITTAATQLFQLSSIPFGL